MQIGQCRQATLGAKARAAYQHQCGCLFGHIDLSWICVAQFVLLIHGAQCPIIVGHQHVLEFGLQLKEVPASILGEIILGRLIVEAVQLVDGDYEWENDWVCVRMCAWDDVTYPAERALAAKYRRHGTPSPWVWQMSLTEKSCSVSRAAIQWCLVATSRCWRCACAESVISQREESKMKATDNLNGAKHTCPKKLIVTVACRATLSLSATVVSPRDCEGKNR